MQNKQEKLDEEDLVNQERSKNEESAERLESFAHNVAENYFLHFSLRQNAILNKLSEKAPQKYLDNLIKIMSSYLYKPASTIIDNSKNINSINVAFSNRLFELKQKTNLLEEAKAAGKTIEHDVFEDGHALIRIKD